MFELAVPDSWLKMVGFTLGNPFTHKEADAEEKLLQCFVDKPYFYELLGNATQPRTAFLVADRGCGKSANRRMIEQYCREGKAGGMVLTVPYLDSTLLLPRIAGQPAQSIVDLHVDQILKQAVVALMDLLQEKPDLVERLYAEGYRRLLKWHLENYSNLLSPHGMDVWLKQAGLLSKNVNARTLREAADGRYSKELRAAMETTAGPLIELLVTMLHQEPADIRLETTSYLDLMRSFVDLADVLGVEVVYVLIDRVDEIQETALDPEEAANLLEPLAMDLRLLEMPRVVFKFFIPSSVATILKQRGIRLDRLLFREISWSEDDLLSLLDRRVWVYSEGHVPNLEQISTPEMSGLSRRMVAEAQGSPRNLLRLGEWLLYQHHLRAGNSGDLLKEEDFQAALKSYRDELRVSALPQRIAEPQKKPARHPIIITDEDLRRYGLL